MKLFRSRTFFRYMLSHMLILFLPVLILLLTCGRAIIDRSMESMLQQNAGELTRMSETFDQQLEQLIRVSYMIQSDGDLNPAAIGGNVVKARAATSKLMRFQSMAMLPAYLYLYRSGDEYVYTSSGMISPQKLFEQQYVYACHSLSDFYAVIDQPDSIVTWPSDKVTQFGGNTEEYLTLFVAVHTGNIAPKTRTVFLLPVSSLPAFRLADRRSVFILDKDGAPLAASGDVAYDLVREKLSGEGGSRIAAGNVEYFVSRTISRITGWTYAVLTPIDALEAPLRHLQQTLILGLLLIFLVGGTLVSVFSVRQYRPLQHLTQKAQELVDCETTGSEMAQVELALDYLQSARNEYKASFDANRANLTHEELLQLFFGDGSRVEEIAQNLQRVGETLQLDAEYQVVLLHMTDADPAVFENRLRTALTLPSVGLEETLVFVNHRLPGQIAVLMPVAAQSELLMRLEALQDALEEDGKAAVSMGISLACLPQTLHLGYQQAEQALACRMVRGKHCIVFYTHREAEQQSIAYPQKEMQELQWHLLQLDEQETKRVLNRLVQELECSSISLGTARMIGFDVLNTVVKSLSTLGAAEDTMMAGEIDRLASFHTIHDLTGMLEELIDETCRSIRAMREQQPDARMTQLRTYIDEHCFQPDFSINTVSDHFELSPSNLSHYFKKNMGISLSDYIQSRRKEEACRLLTSTQLSVQEIGERLGMMNVTSFIRSFKQQTGVTPGQYRKLHV